MPATKPRKTATPSSTPKPLQPAAAPAARPASTKKTAEQPIGVLSIPGALMMPRTTSAVAAMSIPTLYRKVAAGQFPAPVRIGKRCTRWRSDDVRAWLAAQA